MGAPTWRLQGSSDAGTMGELQRGDHRVAPMQGPRESTNAGTTGELRRGDHGGSTDTGTTGFVSRGVPVISQNISLYLLMQWRADTVPVRKHHIEKLNADHCSSAKLRRITDNAQLKSISLSVQAFHALCRPPHASWQYYGRKHTKDWEFPSRNMVSVTNVQTLEH